MGLSEERVNTLQNALSELLEPELGRVVEMMRTGSNNSPFVKIPTGSDIDLSPHDLSDLVARSSNAYVEATRANAYIGAQFKLAEGAYKAKLKAHGGVGSNAKEREANAMAAAAKEYQAFVTLDAMKELTQGAENAARVASESARKLLDKSASMQVGSAREERGHVKTFESGW